jgi:uncharacterized protein (TIGR02466 family)
MKTTDIFAQTIYEVEFPNFENIQQQIISNLTNNFNKQFVNEYEGHDHPTRGGAITMIYDKFTKTEINDPLVQQVHDFINEHGKEYWKILNLSRYLNPYVLQLWVNGVAKGGFTASHNHNPVPVAGVFYINSRPELGNLFLENPLDLVLGKSSYHSDTRTPTRFNHEVQATSGKLVLFPGWMKHFTKPNPTDEIRISMAVNFGCAGQVQFSEFI